MTRLKEACIVCPSADNNMENIQMGLMKALPSSVSQWLCQQNAGGQEGAFSSSNLKAH